MIKTIDYSYLCTDYFGESLLASIKKTGWKIQPNVSLRRHFTWPAKLPGDWNTQGEPNVPDKLTAVFDLDHFVD